MFFAGRRPSFILTGMFLLSFFWIYWQIQEINNLNNKKNSIEEVNYKNLDTRTEELQKNLINEKSSRIYTESELVALFVGTALETCSNSWWFTEISLVELLQNNKISSKTLYIGVYYSQFKWNCVQQSMSSVGFSLVRTYGVLESGFQLIYSLPERKIDIIIFIYYRIGKYYWHSNEMKGYNFSYYEFSVSRWDKFGIPSSIEHYLEQRYGDNLKKENLENLEKRHPSNVFEHCPLVKSDYKQFEKNLASPLNGIMTILKQKWKISKYLYFMVYDTLWDWMSNCTQLIPQKAYHFGLLIDNDNLKGLNEFYRPRCDQNCFDESFQTLSSFEVAEVENTEKLTTFQLHHGETTLYIHAFYIDRKDNILWAKWVRNIAEEPFNFNEETIVKFAVPSSFIKVDLGQYLIYSPENSLDWAESFFSGK